MYHFNVHTAYHNIFIMNPSILKHNNYVETKQFSNVDIKQKNIPTVILLIFSSINGTRAIWKEVALYSHLTLRIIFIVMISDMHKDWSSLRMKNWN